MKNKNGEFLIVPLLFGIAFGAAGLACLWHIPAWSKAKKEGKTKEYQAQKMWPQEEFAKLPGGENYNK